MCCSLSLKPARRYRATSHLSCAVRCSAVCCSAVCCSVVQCVAVQCIMVQCVAVLCVAVCSLSTLLTVHVGMSSLKSGICCPTNLQKRPNNLQKKPIILPQTAGKIKVPSSDLRQIRIFTQSLLIYTADPCVNSAPWYCTNPIALNLSYHNYNNLSSSVPVGFSPATALKSVENFSLRI